MLRAVRLDVFRFSFIPRWFVVAVFNEGIREVAHVSSDRLIKFLSDDLEHSFATVIFGDVMKKSANGLVLGAAILEHERAYPDRVGEIGNSSSTLAGLAVLKSANHRQRFVIARGQNRY